MEQAREGRPAAPSTGSTARKAAARAVVTAMRGLQANMDGNTALLWPQTMLAPMW
jgi:hypothetical protein